ncbi:MAG: PH domain-containing protein [Leptolyngbyaceae cyanobacterium bins.59]|nr:PH domain-containing protein [Leptolyngbyaceae cyanobacterium bins.59]
MRNDDRETILWEGTPSQLTNLGTFVLCSFVFGLILAVLVAVSRWLRIDSPDLRKGLILVLTLGLALPILVALWKWLQVQSQRYQVTTERIFVSYGIFMRQTDEVELFRVRDVSFTQTLFLRLFSLSNLTLMTTDPSHQAIVLKAIPQARALWDRIRQHSELCRRRKGISEVDFT